MPPYRALVTRSGEDRGKPYFLKNASRLQPGTGKGPQRHCQPKQLRNNPRGCFNAPRSYPPSPTPIPRHPRPHTRHPRLRSGTSPTSRNSHPRQKPQPTKPSFRRRNVTPYPDTGPESRGAGGLPSVPHEVEPATSHNRHPRPHIRHPRRPFPGHSRPSPKCHSERSRGI